MSHWSVFVANYQQQDAGRPFAVGDDVEWPVVLIDGRQNGWPPELLKPVRVSLSPTGTGAADVSIAHSGHMTALWRGAARAGSTLEIDAALEVDYLSPPFVPLRGRVEKIVLVSQRHISDSAGTLIATWTGWTGTELQEAPRRFRVLPTEREAICDTGLLVSLSVS